MSFNSSQNSIQIQRLKDGAVIADENDGTIYNYLGSKQVVEGYDNHGGEYASVSRVYRCAKLGEPNQIRRFQPTRKFILLEGEKRW